MAGGVVRGRRAAAVPVGERGEAGRRAGEGQGAAGGRRAEHEAARRGPDRALPGPRPAAPRRSVVPQACAHPAPAVRAVCCPGHRRGDLPGHQDAAHAEDRQRRADRERGDPGSRDDLRPGRLRHRGRLPGQPAAGQGALAGRRPPATPGPGERGRGIGAVGRPGRDPRRGRHRQARPGAGRRAARGTRRADGSHRRLQRAAVGRADRA